MKVLLVNGSAKKNGTTAFALSEIAAVLKEAGIETEIFHVGAKPISGCIGCNQCGGKGKCMIADDAVNELIQKAAEADGFIFGSPVHYAAASGAITSLLDRSFYAGGKNFTCKPGAAIVVCRRGGATAAVDQLNKYMTINRMPVVSSQYWNMVHGNNSEEAKMDGEGLQIMRTLGRNMAWLLKCIEAGEAAGVHRPEREAPVRTNFIR